MLGERRPLGSLAARHGCGFVFLSWATLVYVFAYDGSDVSGRGWLFVALTLRADG